MAARYIGSKIKRTEDPRLVTGTATYVDDIVLPEMLYCAILRSPHAHARLSKIDVSRAEKMPGVVAIVDGKQLQKQVGTIPCAASLEGLKVPAKYPLAFRRAIFVGDPVLAVVAKDRYGAQDAVEEIDIEYQPLPAVTDPRQALDPSSPLVHPEFKTNQAYSWVLEGGDMAGAFKKADRIVKLDMNHQRLIPTAMETRGVVARYDPGSRQLTLWSSTQIPHLMKTQVALMLGLPENLVRVIAPEVGGGFGSKLNVYAEEALLGYLAKALCKPVKWIEGRRENMSATTHGRAQYGTVEVAVKKTGKILGIRYQVVADMGAYHQLLTPAIPTLTGLMLTGAYDIPAARMDVKGVFTNRMSTDAYRGAGRPEATFVIERVVDAVALELGLDPSEIRKTNFAKKFPHHTATQLAYDSGDYERTLTKALRLAGYKDLRKRQAQARKRGRLIGIGVSSYVEICALGPSKAMPAGGWESATVRVDPTCKVTVLTGASPHGQGQETSFAQITADMLGLALEDIAVFHGDTAIVQYGIGTFGSRATAVGGTAVVRATEQLIEKGKAIAAALLGTDPSRVRFSNGAFRVKGSRRKIGLGEVALEAHTAQNLKPGTEPGLSATYFYEPENFTFPFGAHVCVVEVDRATGEVQFKRYIAVDDCGKVINPLLVDGQIHGGIVQALGQAMMEQAIYDESGQLLSGTLMDYAIPRAHHIPWIESDRTETPSPVNPLGIKGVGEAGTIGATPAIVNAVVDALAPLGVRDIDMPLTPNKIWGLIHAKERA